MLPALQSPPPRSKFDNRLKEFAERWEVDRYLSATGYLPPAVKPFFVALPKVWLAAPWRPSVHERQVSATLLLW